MVLETRTTSITKGSVTMFTGLVAEVGTIASAHHEAAGSRFIVQAVRVLEDLQIGDSVAIDGVCTTVVSLTKAGFAIEVTPETLSKTTMSHYKPGTRVNLEPPLTPTDRIGGHFVTGHVDGLAKLLAKVIEGNSWICRFELEDATLAPFLVAKGSVTISGISLTVNTVENEIFTVAIIPHTLKNTNLSDVSVGGMVNVETDILGKYVRNFINPALYTVMSDIEDFDDVPVRKRTPSEAPV